MKTAIGIDIGGTKIKACLADVKGNVLSELQVATKAEEGREAVLTQIDQMVETLLRDNTIGGGIGSPGIIDTETAVVAQFGFNIKEWPQTNLTKRLEEKYPSLSWHADNDANCAALGEYWVGAGKGFSSFIMITLGTGVGGAVFSKKEGIHHGFYSEAGEMGHMIFQPKGRQCNCGQKGCIEQYISGTALNNFYLERAGKPPVKSIFSLIRNDEIARAIVSEFEENLAYYLISLKQLFDPEAFIIGGGLIHEKSVWWERFSKLYASEMSFSPRTKLVPAKCLNEAGMLGAAFLALQNGVENES